MARRTYRKNTIGTKDYFNIQQNNIVVEHSFLMIDGYTCLLLIKVHSESYIMAINVWFKISCLLTVLIENMFFAWNPSREKKTTFYEIYNAATETYKAIFWSNDTWLQTILESNFSLRNHHLISQQIGDRYDHIVKIISISIKNPLQRRHVEDINSLCGVYMYSGGVGSNASDTTLGTRFVQLIIGVGCVI
jgi:hypothetical protein